MSSLTHLGLSLLCAALLIILALTAYYVFLAPRLNPLRQLAGPPVRTLFGNHMSSVLDPFRSPKTHSMYIEKYGRSIRIRGLGPWDDRLLPLDPVSVAHVLKNSIIYEKPWQSRRLITSLIGCGMLAAEGHVHKRQRRVATPGFSIQNLRALVPLVFQKGNELQEKWQELLSEIPQDQEAVCSPPDQEDVTPEQGLAQDREVATSEQGVTQDQEVVTSVQGVTRGQEDGTLDQGVTPEQEMVPPEQGVTPEHDGVPPNQEGATPAKEGVEIDVCHWISRATFDVIGLAGFDYNFNAIQNESDELFCAYKEMFEIAVSQGDGFRTVLGIYFPLLNFLLPDVRVRTVKRCQAVIRRVAGKLVQSKKANIMESEKSGTTESGKDLLSLLLKSNVATDIPPDQRISDEDILHNINTFMFAGSDTTSLALTWTLLLLARHPEIQTRLRTELLSIAPSTPISRLAPEEIESFHVELSKLPYLNNVARESLRLVPPVHSSLRVATQDDEIPVSYPVHLSDGSISDLRSVRISKGTFVHVPVEALNLDKEIWGENAWDFYPDRWNRLPEAAKALPGLYSNLLTFSAGPRSCIGMRFSMIEMKTFLYILLTNFVFAETEKKVYKANVVLTRPYVSGQFKKGSQCPLLVKRFNSEPL